jgi:Flp pilus assembly protein TadG
MKTFPLRTLAKRLLRHWPAGRARRDVLGRRSVAAVEFAIIVPVLLVMFIGTIEVITLYRAEGKVNALAFDVAQMVSVEPSPTTLATANQTSINDICQGAILGLAPFPPNGLTIQIVSVTLEPSKLSSNTAASPPAFDEWEADSTVANGHCSTTATNGFGVAAAESLATTNPPVTTAAAYNGTSGEVEVPCDNMVVVKASMTYPGITGLILMNHPVLTQTAFTRFRYASPTDQLQCSDCSLNPKPALDYCNATSTATD